MTEVIARLFKDGEFHYKTTWKHAKLVDKAISKIDREEQYLDEFVMILNGLIKKHERRTSDFAITE